MVIMVDSPLARGAARGAALLRAGRLNEGFALFDGWRADPQNLDKAPALPFPLWRGQPVCGKRVLIWSEHGLGDQIMYARFAKVLADQGAEIVWLCPPALARLFRSLGVTVLSSDANHDLRCDFYCPSSALPLGFDLSPETLPNDPYLTAAARPSGARIGLMPDASKADRSLPDGIAQALLRDLGALDLRPASTGARDLQDTADLLAGLDLVITVDTAVAHLSGAMGRPTWILLSDPCDWRWMVGRSDSPWYPSATLFRGAWPEVAAQVRARHRLQSATAR
jgi:hypothetical protein